MSNRMMLGHAWTVRLVSEKHLWEAEWTYRKFIKQPATMFAHFKFQVSWGGYIWGKLSLHCGNQTLALIRQNQSQEKSRDLLGVAVTNVDLPANTEHVHNPCLFWCSSILCVDTYTVFMYIIYNYTHIFWHHVTHVYTTLKPPGDVLSTASHLFATSKLLGIQKGMEFAGHPCSVPSSRALEPKLGLGGPTRNGEFVTWFRIWSDS